MRKCEIEANGTCAIDRIEIVRNNRVYFTEPGKGRWDITLSVKDTAPEREVDYYYVHVVQRDSEQAWASPVWVGR